jgi:hypothetical protein
MLIVLKVKMVGILEEDLSGVFEYLEKKLMVRVQDKEEKLID